VERVTRIELAFSAWEARSRRRADQGFPDKALVAAYVS
jgi:hypothetical protein